MGMGTRLQLGHGKEWKRMWMGMRMTPIPMGKKFPDFFTVVDLHYLGCRPILQAYILVFKLMGPYQLLPLFHHNLQNI